jgi:hypothetical protein
LANVSRFASVLKAAIHFGQKVSSPKALSKRGREAIGEIVPAVVEIEDGGCSGPGGVARTAFCQERRNGHEERVRETRWCWQRLREEGAKEAS